MDLSHEAQEFLWYSYFGDQFFNNKDKVMKQCIDRAYLDLNRTLVFSSKNEDEHKTFRNAMRSFISQEIKNNILEAKPDDFDCRYIQCCNSIVCTAKETGQLDTPDDCNQVFFFGQAQKWLNMTLKYMRLSGLWDDFFKMNQEVLHVPVDSFILKAASRKEKDQTEYGLSVKVPRKNGDKGIYSDGASKSWSRWDDTDYLSIDGDNSKSGFIHDLREALCEAKKDNKQDFADISTISEWESVAWIEQAKKDKEKKVKRKQE